MLYLLRSRANTGKSQAVLERIAQNEAQRGQILLVPDHASFAAEVDLCHACGPSASRYAEVLTFQRLTRRVLEAAGGVGELSLDNGGKVLMMQRAIQDVSSVLTVYCRPSQKVAFLRQFIDLVEELQRYQVSPEDLMAQADALEGDMGDKFRDISLIAAAYLGRLCRDGVNLTDDMDKLLHSLEASGYVDGKDVYLDGFAHFTAQEMAALGILLRRCHSVTVTLLGERGSKLEIFQAGNRAYEALVDLAISAGSRVEDLEPTVRSAAIQPESGDPLAHLEANFFGQGEIFAEKVRNIRLYEANNLYTEVEYTAAEIRRLVAKEGYRYRDIGVVVRHLDDYADTVESVFQRYEIPVYRSSRSDILDKSVVALLLSALDTVSGGWEYEDVFRCLKTGLAGIDHAAGDILENYVIRWDIRGAMWRQVEDWTANPDGYSQELTPDQVQRLEEINAIRHRFADPLCHLQEGLTRESGAAGKMRALYAYLEEIDLPGQLEEKTRRLGELGELQLADEYRQLWELLCHIMDQFVEILGDSPLNREEFVRLLKLVVSQYSVGTIPAALDQVSFSELSLNDRHRIKILFLLGANDHVLPAVDGGGGILTEEDRETLLTGGIRLAPYGMEKLALELQNIYAALVKPQGALYVTYPATDRNGTALRPAFLVGRIRRLFPGITLEKEGNDKSFRLTATQPALETLGSRIDTPLGYFLASHGASAARISAMERAGSMSRGRLSSEAVQALYGSSFRMSASRMDKVKSCHFAYFMQYGLRAKERTPAGLDPSQIGTFLHYVLEHVTQEAQRRGGFQGISSQELRQMVEACMDQYIAATMGDVDTKAARFRYLLGRLRRTACTIMENVAGELAASEFVPLSFELEFGPEGALPAITIQEPGATLSVSGKVDRVDGWVKDGKLYLRVVDYKTGKKAFDLADLKHGLNVQMLLYLFLLEREGKSLYGYDIIPAGVLYLPARDVILRMDRGTTAEQLQKAVDKELRRSGLLLGDATVLTAMERTALEEPRYLPLSLDRSHNITRGIASAEQLGKLSRYLDRLLHEITREIRDGNIDADPCCHSENDSACTYCEFASACHFVDGQDSDHLDYIRPVKPEEFWAFVEEETGEVETEERTAIMGIVPSEGRSTEMRSSIETTEGSLTPKKTAVAEPEERAPAFERAPAEEMVSETAQTAEKPLRTAEEDTDGTAFVAGAVSVVSAAEVVSAVGVVSENGEIPMAGAAAVTEKKTQTTQGEEGEHG